MTSAAATEVSASLTGVEELKVLFEHECESSFSGRSSATPPPRRSSRSNTSKTISGSIPSSSSSSSRSHLFHAMRHMVTRRLVIASLFYILNVAATLCTPVAIFALLKWVERDPSSSSSSHSMYILEGVAYVLALGVASITGFIAEDRFDRWAKSAGIHCRSAVLGLLYEKVLSQRLVDVAAAASSGVDDDDDDDVTTNDSSDATSKTENSTSNSGASEGGAAGSGELHNLFSVDSSHMLTLWGGVLTLMLQPLEIIGIVGMLYAYVYEAAFGGVAVVCLTLTIAHAGATKLEHISAERAKLTDIRVRDLNECLLGMKVVKLNAWEDRFASLVLQTRANESRHTRRQAWPLSAVNTASSNGIDVISLAVIVLFTFALGNVLDPATVFTYWVLLGMLHGRIFHFPVSLRHAKEGMNSLRRIQSFLLRPNVDTSRYSVIHKTAETAETAPSSSPPPASTHTAAVTIEVSDASFSWVPLYTTATPPEMNSNDVIINPMSTVAATELNATTTNSSSLSSFSSSSSSSSSILQDVNFTLQPGEMLGIVGPVGSGKSTLLTALLGEVSITTGKVNISVSAETTTSFSKPSNNTEYLAIVPQTAWIITGTMKENIIFGRAYDEKWYNQVVMACALTSDFASFPDGDNTCVAVFTLSGGQKQRISIARACYGRASLYLFDDCLSALDSRVSAHLLTHVLSSETGILGKQTTKILVTNTAAALEHCTQIACLKPVVSQSGNGKSNTTSSSNVSPSFAPAPAPSSPSISSSSSSSRSHRNPPRHHHHQQQQQQQHGPFTLIVGTPQEMRAHPAFTSAIAAMTAAHGPMVDEVVVTPSSSSTNEMQSDVPFPQAKEELMQSISSITASGAVSSVAAAAAASSSSTSSSVVVTSTSDAEQSSSSSNSLPFFSSWLLGAGGVWYAIGVSVLLALEASFVEISVILLAQWSEDSASEGNNPKASDRTRFDVYLAIYGSVIICELICAYVRQHVYVKGTTKAADELHAALLFRICHAPQSLFDTHSLGGILHWFSRDIASIDSETFYASEYFWLGMCYGGLVVFVELYVTAYVLIPFIPVLFCLWVITRSKSRVRVGSNTDRTFNNNNNKKKNSNIAENMVSIPAVSVEVATTLSSSSTQSPPSPPATSPSTSSSSIPPITSSSLVPAPSFSQRVSLFLDRLHPPDVEEKMSAETDAKVPLIDHFAATLDGLVSIRAYSAITRFIAKHHALADLHSERLMEVAAAQSVQVLVSNLIGALYYIGSTAVIVPLHLVGEISGGNAGFIVVNSCFSSYMATMVIQQRAVLTALALTRGELVRAIMTMPQESSVKDDPQTEAKALEIERKFGPYYAQMVARKSGEGEGGRKEPISNGTSLGYLPQELQQVTIKNDSNNNDNNNNTSTATTVEQPPLAWPSQGELVLSDLKMRYRHDSPFVLKGVNLRIEAGTHCGVVGRTGAGKSSLIAAITRLVEPERPSASEEGSPPPAPAVSIDGVDVSKIPLAKLRDAVTVISQDPLFFSGSLRRNLDPFGVYAESDLITALKAVRLYEFAVAQVRVGEKYETQNSTSSTSSSSSSSSSNGDGTSSSSSSSSSLQLVSTPSPLDMIIAERGSNLSIGQQQLLALARALLRKPKLVCLDEATASLDAQTEEMVHDTVDIAFANATVFQIAHRLASVISCDKVIVMSDGIVAEVGHPWELLNNSKGENGIFASMVNSAPAAQRDSLKAKAQKEYEKRNEREREKEKTKSHTA